MLQICYEFEMNSRRIPDGFLTDSRRIPDGAQTVLRQRSGDSLADSKCTPGRAWMCFRKYLDVSMADRGQGADEALVESM